MNSVVSSGDGAGLFRLQLIVLSLWKAIAASESGDMYTILVGVGLGVPGGTRTNLTPASLLSFLNLVSEMLMLGYTVLKKFHVSGNCTRLVLLSPC